MFLVDYVLGAWNRVTQELVSVTNTTVVNTETMCELLHKIAALGIAALGIAALGLLQFAVYGSGFLLA